MINMLPVSTGDQGSGILKSMVTANALIVMGENETRIKKGAQVTVQLLDDSLSRSESFQLTRNFSLNKEK